MQITQLNGSVLDAAQHHAVGLPELIARTTEQYESLAIELANNPVKLSSLKARLAENRATCPLFNTALFTQHIESAYQAAYNRYHEGLAPDHIYVSSSLRHRLSKGLVTRVKSSPEQ